jgi:hypothetical protein
MTPSPATTAALRKAFVISAPPKPPGEPDHDDAWTSTTVWTSTASDLLQETGP